MKYRIAVWAMVGFLVSCGWFFYSSAFQSPMTPAEPVVWNLAIWTQPFLLLGVFRFALKFYWVFLLNATTYALLGLAFETLRHQFKHAH
jgi:hypothetical protein